MVFSSTCIHLIPAKTPKIEKSNLHLSTYSFQQSYYTISCEVIKATSINHKISSSSVD